MDAADALLQILGMGAEPYMVGAALMGIVAQRTLRLNCQKCQGKDVVSRDRLKELGIPVGMQPSAFFHGTGCDNCLKTGFDRETSIFEVFDMNDEFRVRLTPSMKSEAFRSAMKTSGLMTLRQVALHKAINGQTSLSEVFRITQ
jgi:type II secretory ATPase GspE/PulE/Tfp pilus assembly ATPase PilB-like protein